MNGKLNIRVADEKDIDATWEIFKDVIHDGDTYVYPTNTSRNEFEKIWFTDNINTYVAEFDDVIIGSFIIKDNQPGLGSHIANASYMVHSQYRGNQIGLAMGEYSLIEAKELGYKAMQFNIVVKSNVSALQLWEKLGFQIIGEIPNAFQHKELGLTNGYILYRKL
ncbi:MAG: GNAT family N-acetyltransferase [Bacteroidetes bacterium]|nr:GNAT family N-acetyltransferase [Bacteroidia bacterium]MBN4052172.1 GNAT family N-acetyltransferase [Sphingobacteriaceae bacterium AH-315-L07]PCH67637.1 MAG: GNAT family N-acetyltransferase [Bacteroidota bacterium]